MKDSNAVYVYIFISTNIIWESTPNRSIVYCRTRPIFYKQRGTVTLSTRIQVEHSNGLLNNFATMYIRTCTFLINNVNRRSNNVNEHVEDEYSNHVANKTTNERFQCNVHNIYSRVDSKPIDRQLPDASNLIKVT